MDYKEKLKEALNSDNTDYEVVRWIEQNFPELKESGDERIRQDIITTLSMGVACEESALHPGAHTILKEAIAWLEKQGKNNMGISEATKQKLADNLNEALEKETPESLNEFLDEQGEKHIDRELSNLLHRVICRFINDPNIPYSERDEVSKKIIPYVEQLEKQGEHANFINKIQVGDKVTRNEDGVLVNLSQLNRIAKKQGEQKPSDKVEPKFKVGDWVVWDNKISCHVDNIYQGKESLMYTITDTNNMTRSYSVKGFGNNAHIWTIKDAKDGDVLVASDGSIFLFKDTIDCACKHYAAITTDGTVKFNEGLEHFWETSTAVHPATKEQRDLLFKKMHEAGYEWDAEKKELKKIEQNTADKEYAFKAIPRLLEMIQPTDRAKSYCQKLIDSLEQEGYSADAKIVRGCLKQMNGEKVAMATMDWQRSAWSEEDESVISLILSICNDFLESFEISPASTKVVKEDIDKIENWFKFLKERYAWKPSDEQMKALQESIGIVGELTSKGECLKELVEQLKKLREK